MLIKSLPLTCGIAHTQEKNQAPHSISFPRLRESVTFRGCSTAKYLSMETQTSTLDERYSPNARRNRNTLQAMSPASHWVVIRQPISSGIMMKVTTRSATVRLMMSSDIRELRGRRRISDVNTLKLPTAAITNSTEYTTTTLSESLLNLK